MVQSLPGFLNLCLDVCSPSQVLGDVYTEVLEAALGNKGIHLLQSFSVKHDWVGAGCVSLEDLTLALMDVEAYLCGGRCYTGHHLLHLLLGVIVVPSHLQIPGQLAVSKVSTGSMPTLSYGGLHHPVDRQ